MKLNSIGARVIGAVLAVTLAAFSAVADLTPQQKQFARTVQQRLDQAATNLKGAEDAAGPAGSATNESRARLALTRSGSARAQLTTVQDALKKLPADDATVAKMAEQVAKMDAGIVALEKRLNAGPPEPAAGGPGAGTAKLDYQQEKLLKDARSYIDELGGYAAALDKVAANVTAAKEADLIDHQALANAAATIERARGRQKYVADYFAKLPADGVGVPPARKDADAAGARIEAAAKVIDPANARVRKVIDPASYPAYADDLARLKTLGAMFGDPTVLEARPLRAAEAYGQLAAADEEVIRVRAAYAAFLAQKADSAKAFDSALRFVEENRAAFVAAAAKVKQKLPEEIAGLMKRTTDLAEQAVAEKKPAFFTGGIPASVERISIKVALLKALDPAAGAAAEKTVAALHARLKGLQASLRDQIIAENPLPPDRYAGADKAEHVKRAMDAWAKAQPGARVLAVRIPSERWERETMLRKQNRTWYLVDRSRLQAQVIVDRGDGRTAVIQPVNLWIDHADGDKVSAIPMNDAKDEAPPSLVMLAEKVK